MNGKLTPYFSLTRSMVLALLVNEEEHAMIDPTLDTLTRRLDWLERANRW